VNDRVPLRGFAGSGPACLRAARSFSKERSRTPKEEPVPPAPISIPGACPRAKALQSEVLHRLPYERARLRWIRISSPRVVPWTLWNGRPVKLADGYPCVRDPLQRFRILADVGLCLLGGMEGSLFVARWEKMAAQVRIARPRIYETLAPKPDLQRFRRCVGR